MPPKIPGLPWQLGRGAGEAVGAWREGGVPATGHEEEEKEEEEEEGRFGGISALQRFGLKRSETEVGVCRGPGDNSPLLPPTQCLHLQLFSPYSPIAYMGRPQVRSSYSQAECKHKKNKKSSSSSTTTITTTATQKTVHYPLWGKKIKRESINHSIYNPAGMSCHHRHTHTHTQILVNRKIPGSD